MPRWSLEQTLRQRLRQTLGRGWLTSTDAEFVPPVANIICHLNASVQTDVVFESTEGTGNPINQWTDKSGNGNHFVKAATNQPDWIENAQNSLGAVSFSSVSSEYLENTSPFLSGTDDGHIFIVHQSTDLISANSGWMRFGSHGLDNHFTWSASDRIFCGFGSTTRKDCGIPTHARNWHLLEIHSAASDWELLQNDSSEFSTGTSTVGWNVTSFLLGLSDTLYGSFEMGEIIIYDAVKTGADRTAIIDGLNTKWGLGF